MRLGKIESIGRSVPHRHDAETTWSFSLFDSKPSIKHFKFARQKPQRPARAQAPPIDMLSRIVAMRDCIMVQRSTPLNRPRGARPQMQSVNSRSSDPTTLEILV
jgi:hypothetical protein